MAFIIGKLVRYVVVLILIFSLGCSGGTRADNFPIYLRYVSELIRSFTKEMKEEMGLICSSSGGGMPHDVESISLGFIAYQKATIDEARKLEVTIIEKFLKKINGYKKIRPFLREYPFSAKRAEIAISFRNKKDDSSNTDGSVARVFQTRNIVYYRADDPITDKFVPLFDEPYPEALKTVQAAAIQ